MLRCCTLASLLAPLNRKASSTPRVEIFSRSFSECCFCALLPLGCCPRAVQARGMPCLRRDFSSPEPIRAKSLAPRSGRLSRASSEVDLIQNTHKKAWKSPHAPKLPKAPPKLVRLQSEELQALSAKVEVLRQQVLARLPAFPVVFRDIAGLKL